MTDKERSMVLVDAKARAGRFVALIADYSERVLVVGSIRRLRSEVHDVDVVAIPKIGAKEGWFGPDRVNLLEQRMQELILGGRILPRVKKDGRTMVGKSVAFVEFEGWPVDVYYAAGATWYGLVQVRTGSAAYNTWLASQALQQGKRFHADGTGIWNGEQTERLDDGKSEQSIFAALGLGYVEPEKREAGPPHVPPQMRGKEVRA